MFFKKKKINKNQLISLLGCLIIIINIFIPSTALAIDSDFYNSNDILFYDPTETNCTSNTAANPDKNQVSSSAEEFIINWHDTAVNIEINYGIPWEAVMAQGGLESGWGNSNYARTKHAFFGVNAVDKNPNAGYAYATDELSWYGQTNPASYAEFIRDNPRYRNNGAFNFVNDPFSYVAAIKSAGYATDPDYVSLLSSIINKNIRPISSKNGWKDSAGVASEHPEATANAQKNAQGNTSSVSQTKSASNCSDALSPGGITTVGGAVSLLQEFIDNVNSTYKFNLASVEMPNGYKNDDEIKNNIQFSTPGHTTSGCWVGDCGQCTAMSAWFINSKTNYKYGRGNGINVVDNLATVNGVSASKTPTPYSVFSKTSSVPEGHTGVVIGLKDDGTIITLENNWGRGGGYGGGGNFGIGVYSKDKYSSGWEFFPASDKLK